MENRIVQLLGGPLDGARYIRPEDKEFPFYLDQYGREFEVIQVSDMSGPTAAYIINGLYYLDVSDTNIPVYLYLYEHNLNAGQQIAPSDIWMYLLVWKHFINMRNNTD